MKLNVGNTDKYVRLVLGALLIILVMGGILQGTMSYVGLGVAAILIVTALINFCPLYALFGLSSCPVPSDKSKTSG